MSHEPLLVDQRKFYIIMEPRTIHIMSDEALRHFSSREYLASFSRSCSTCDINRKESNEPLSTLGSLSH
jgi:hypothetical protein